MDNERVRVFDHDQVNGLTVREAINAARTRGFDEIETARNACVKCAH